MKSKSPYVALVILLWKKDGSFGLCIHSRGLNEIRLKIKFPIPFIDKMLNELLMANFVSRLDLRSGYYQICCVTS
jgi:hypothetical protein